MIGPKTPRPSKADERRAYQAATERDHNKCVRCDAVGIERDHRKNRSQGGLTTVANLQGLCRACHQWKNDNPREALISGHAVPSYARPELWPAWRYGVGWVIYDDHGSWQEISEDTAEFIMSSGGRT